MSAGNQRSNLMFLCIIYTVLICFFGTTGAIARDSSLGAGSTVEGSFFADPSRCSRCHDGLYDEDGIDVSFVRNWETTMMRFSFFDPFWRAKLKSEAIRIPGAARLIEEKCARCHAPMASVQAKYDGLDIYMFGAGGLLDVESKYHELAMQGVGCTLCHQLEAPSSDSGAFSVSSDKVAWGPFFPDFQNTMERATGFTPEFNFHPMDPEFCATCHNLFTDYFDQDGVKQSTPETLFPEQAPYLEWLASSFPEENQTCQSCHMHQTDAVKISQIPRQTSVRDDVFTHTFLTENTMMLDIMSSVAESQGIDIPDLSNAMADGEDYIAGAGTIEILDSIAWVNYDDDEQFDDLSVTLKVTNNAGHKLPTSIPVRRVFIHFAVYNSGGQSLFSSGDTDDEGRIVGVDFDDTPLAFEAHYDKITAEDQVQVYEGIMENWENEVTYTLLRAARFKKDNRLLPRGFSIPTAPQNILPVGVVDENFVGGTDEVTYIVRNIRGNGELKIEVELKDQTLSYRMVQDLIRSSSEDDSGLIDLFYEEYQHHKVHYELIDSDEIILEAGP
ncbi:MAG: hypothetical protein ACI8ZB_004353 [Desulforhopalus sp.]|jgi:hypothetical protein